MSARGTITFSIGASFRPLLGALVIEAFMGYRQRLVEGCGICTIGAIQATRLVFVACFGNHK